MNKAELEKTVTQNLQDQSSFGQHLLHLLPHKITEYQVDLAAKSTTYVDQRGDIFFMKLPIEIKKPVKDWNEKTVKSAILAIQRKDISYKDFLNLISEGGVFKYIVDINGQKVTYLGEEHSHIENFPKALADSLR